jgi:hypothetical protein
MHRLGNGRRHFAGRAPTPHRRGFGGFDYNAGLRWKRWASVKLPPGRFRGSSIRRDRAELSCHARLTAATSNNHA